MKKKQLLATLVMLSLMQGSVYAADNITEDNFDKTTNIYTPISSDIGPIYIINKKGKDYIINAPSNCLNITDAKHRAIIVGVDPNEYASKMSSLTINGNVNIGSDDKQIEIQKGDSVAGTVALVQTGLAGRNQGGKLVIKGDLTIKNVNFSNADNLIYLGGKDPKNTASSFSVYDITIDNVTGGKAGNIIKFETTYNDRNYPVTLTTGNIKITNSNVDFGIYGDQNYGSKFNSGNIEFENVNVAQNAIEVKNLNASGNITFKGIGEKNKATFGSYRLFDFENSGSDMINIDGDVIIENVNGTFTGSTLASAFWSNGNGNNSGNFSAKNIKVKNLDMSSNGETYAVRFSNNVKVEIDNVFVENVNFTSTASVNEHAGIYFGTVETDKKITSLKAQNIKSSASQLSNGEGLFGIDFGTSDILGGVGSIIVSDVEGENLKTYGLRVKEQNLKSDYVDITNIMSANNAVGLNVTAGSDADFGTLKVQNVKLTKIDDSSKDDSSKFAAAVNVQNSDLTTDYAYINWSDGATNGEYNGYYAGVASNNEIDINNIALRTVQGADVNWDNINGIYCVNGTIVVGSGAKNAAGGTVNIGGATTQIYGDVYAGNGGEITISLGEGSILEGQVDDYHELENLKKDEVFRNSAFMDSNGNELEVSSAGKATLNINNGGEWIARGQSFVDTVTLDGGTIDMSQNENSSVTVKNLNGEGGKFIMRLDTGDHGNSDMLYVTGTFEGTYELDIIGNEFVASEITEDNPLRFATIKGDVNTENMNARVTDAGFFNNTYKITKEQFDKNHSENEDYNGKNNGQESYKPGNDAVLSMFDNGDTNLLITNEGKQSTVSDAGKTIINMSRANYNNAIYMDRLNKRMGEARYINPEEGQGMWVRLRHDRIGKDDAFRSQNTMYELGYDVKQDCDNGEHRTGFAIDYMDGKTEYRNVAGDGDIKRYGLWLYDTWMGDKGHYADYVLKWGHLENDFDIYNSRGKVNGDYSNNVFSVSAEYGKKNDMGNDWYFEPQAQLQLARVTGADYVTSQK